jgi:hypothetical protein
MFSDFMTDEAKEGCPKLTAKDGKIQQYAVLVKYIFAAELGQSALYLQNSSRFATAVEPYLQQYIVPHCKGNLTNLRQILYSDLAKGNSRLIYKYSM